MVMQGKQATGEFTDILVDALGRIIIVGVAAAPIIVDVSDDWTRLLGQIDLARYLGVAVGPANPVDVLPPVPIQKGRVFDTAVVADTDFFGADLDPTNSPTTFRMYIALDTAGIVSVMRDVGGNTVTENLNQGQQLIANASYMFDFFVTDAETINLQTSVGAQILFCLVLEVPGVG